MLLRDGIPGKDYLLGDGRIVRFVYLWNNEKVSVFTLAENDLFILAGNIDVILYESVKAKDADVGKAYKTREGYIFVPRVKGKGYVSGDCTIKTYHLHQDAILEPVP